MMQLMLIHAVAQLSSNEEQALRNGVIGMSLIGLRTIIGVTQNKVLMTKKMHAREPLIKDKMSPLERYC